jgi:anaerobic selenocysteine-containing dehydrogenase
MRLVTLRSHDQYNTTIYAMDDRYRGVFGRRDVLFMNEQDMAEQGFEHGDRVDISTALPGTSCGWKISRWSPTASRRAPLRPITPKRTCWSLWIISIKSGTPSYKSAPVRLTLRSKEIRALGFANRRLPAAIVASWAKALPSAPESA